MRSAQSTASTADVMHQRVSPLWLAAWMFTGLSCGKRPARSCQQMAMLQQASQHCTATKGEAKEARGLEIALGVPQVQHGCLLTRWQLLGGGGTGSVAVADAVPCMRGGMTRCRGHALHAVLFALRYGRSKPRGGPVVTGRTGRGTMC